MKTVNYAVAVVLLLSGMICTPTTASARNIVDNDLHITFVIPDGFKPITDVPFPPNTDTRYAYRRMNADGTPTLVIVERLSGSIAQKQMSEDVRIKNGIERVYREKWKSFDVEVGLLRQQKGGIVMVTRVIAVPIAPRAIRILVLGTESHDSELAALSSNLLASLDGPTTWLTPNQKDEELGKLAVENLYWMIVVGAVTYGVVAWRTSSFRAKAMAMGHPAEWARQRIRPIWAWYLVPVYLLFAGLGSGATAIILDSTRSVTIIACVAGIVLALGLGWVVMACRVRSKRRILAMPTLPSTPGPTPPPIPTGAR